MAKDPTVYPVFDNKFKVGMAGATGAAETVIANLTTFSPSIEGIIEEWNPMEAAGWGDAMMTGKKLSIAFKGKRTYNDPGNDFIAGLAWKTGNDVIAPFLWEMPSGAKVEFTGIINVTAAGGGDSTNADNLEFEVKCKGKPKFTAAPGV